jgi:hypothetical protein
MVSCADALAVGPASMALQLTPASVVADGASTSVAVATVTDQAGAGVGGLSVYMFATDAAGHQLLMPNPAKDSGGGSYASTLTSSSTAGPVTVIAEVNGTSVSASAVLMQTAVSTTALTAVAGAPVSATNLPVTNQSVTMLATVTASPGNVTPSGAVTFESHGSPIPGCTSIPTPGGGTPSLTVACGASFMAAASPVSLTAAFVPTSGSLVTGSTSPSQDFVINKDPTSSTLTMGVAKRLISAPVTYIARVVPSQLGPVFPSGFVEFLDRGTPIPACAAQPLGAFAVAACSVSYGWPGPHTITAAYSGDTSFTGSMSAPIPVAVLAMGTINTTVLWTFDYLRSYSRVLELQLHGVPVPALVLVSCQGRGCPFRRRALVARRAKYCKATGPRRCAATRTVDLAKVFGQRHLRAGTKITIEISRRYWIGKYFRFTIQPRDAPTVQVACLEPGSSAPRSAC